MVDSSLVLTERHTYKEINFKAANITKPSWLNIASAFWTFEAKVITYI